LTHLLFGNNLISLLLVKDISISFCLKCVFYIILISLSTSWKQPGGQISQIQQQADSPHTTGYLDDPLDCLKNGKVGSKVTDSVNWNSYSGLIFELEGDFDRYHFVLNNAW
jgi:hypothetical protein